MDEIGWGPFLWVQIKIFLSKCLTRERFLHFNGEKLRIPIKFEKLPKVCFICGIINHGSSCRPLEGGMTTPQFDP